MRVQRPDRHPQKRPAVVVQNRHRFDALFLQAEIRELRRFAGAAHGDAPVSVRRERTQHLAQVHPHVAIEVQRVVHELIGEARLLGNALRRDQVEQPVGLDVDALDVALADHPLQVNVREPQRDAELGRQATLRDALIVRDGVEHGEMAAGFDVHVAPAAQQWRLVGPRVGDVVTHRSSSGKRSGSEGNGTGSRPLAHRSRQRGA
jgi:hypothetical protein